MSRARAAAGEGPREKALVRVASGAPDGPPAPLTGVAALEGPELDYVLHCSGCHKRDGSGTPGTVPSLLGIGRFLATAEGRAYLASVPGVAQAPISDERLAALLDWLVEEVGGRPPEPPFTAAEVRAARAHPLRSADEARRRILAAVEGRGRAEPAAAPADARPRGRARPDDPRVRGEGHGLSRDANPRAEASRLRPSTAPGGPPPLGRRGAAQGEGS